eukprot:11175005-Lingulodinium_polyedra.AAC.1
MAPAQLAHARLESQLHGMPLLLETPHRPPRRTVALRAVCWGLLGNHPTPDNLRKRLDRGLLV